MAKKDSEKWHVYVRKDEDVPHWERNVHESVIKKNTQRKIAELKRGV
jgi:hypothetical protein